MGKIMIRREAPTRLTPGMSLNDVIDYMQAGAERAKKQNNVRELLRQAKTKRRKTAAARK